MEDLTDGCKLVHGKDSIIHGHDKQTMQDLVKGTSEVLIQQVNSMRCARPLEH